MTTTNWMTEVEHRFGVSLREHQASAIEAMAVRGESVVLHMPTGGGKSLVFQGMSHLLPGVTVVVFPIRALVKDQQRRVTELGFPGAAFYGATPQRERAGILAGITDGSIKLILTTPETLVVNMKLTAALKTRGVDLLVIDEAHVYEEWAETFRHSYFKLAGAVKRIRPRRYMICSATLTSHGLANASKALAASKWRLVQAPAVRPNLTYDNTPRTLFKAGFKREWPELNPTTLGPAPGIVFFSWVSSLTGAANEKALTYNGSLSARRRRENQEAWIARNEFIFATKAFGMGIDKPNVRTIVHAQFPESVMSYAQECGRAGRDGLPSMCLLDVAENGNASEFLIENSLPPPEILWPIYCYYSKQTPDPDGWLLLNAARVADILQITDQQLRSGAAWLATGGFFERNERDEEWTVQICGYDIAGEMEALEIELDGIAGKVSRATLEEIFVTDNLEKQLNAYKKSGLIEFVKPPVHNAKVRVLRQNASSNEVKLFAERLRGVRERAFARINHMRRLALAHPSARADMIRAAVTLDPTEVQSLVHDERTDSP